MSTINTQSTIISTKPLWQNWITQILGNSPNGNQNKSKVMYMINGKPRSNKLSEEGGTPL